MIQAELFTLLKTTGYPVAYYQFKVDEKSPPPNPPFIVYSIPYSTNFGADNRVYKKINTTRIELYTDKKDLEAEGSLENVLDGASFFYDRTETYIETEKLYQVVYEISI